MGCVSYVVTQGGGEKVGEGKERVQFLEEKRRKSVRSSYGESKVYLGEVNVSRELKGRDSCVCQESVWSPYTCRTRARDRLRLVCIFLMSVSL